MLVNKQFSKISLKITAGFIMFIALAAVFLFLTNNSVLAQGSVANDLLWGGGEGEVQSNLGLGNSDPRIIVAKVVNVFLGFLGIIAVLLIMYAGFLWMTAGGDEAKVAQAKQILVNALIGLVVVLASFGIAAFIVNKFFGTTIGGHGTPTQTSNRIAGGASALGNCTVEMVYPEPGQKEVPRNTIIIITFREEVDSATIIDPLKPGYIYTDGRIKIYKSIDDPAVPANWVTNVQVSTNDNRTFVLDPDDYLGSASEYINYTVYFSNAIQKDSGGGIFNTCRRDYFDWEFKVSNKIDLEPPKILNSGVFPPPDILQDATSSSVAVQARGDITVAWQPQARVIGTMGAPSANGTSPSASISNINENHIQTGTLRLAIENDNVTASLENITSSQLLGSAVASGDTIVFPGYFTITLDNTTDDFVSGNSWDILANKAVVPDTLTVGSNVYAFVSVAPTVNEILVGGTTVLTAGNIRTKINSLSIIDASVAGNLISIIAETAGTAGNNILLTTSTSTALVINSMSGGSGSTETVTIQSRSDKPRNAVIQINFNEAINPMTVSGDATLLSNYIAVKCLNGPECNASNDGFFACGADVCLEGNFVMSNAYRTVEFITNNLCGVNGCGEQIFCLPRDSELRVELVAADFTDCGVDNCASRSPYNICNGTSNCEDATGINFPQADSTNINGVTDVALNTFDGDRGNTAEGPLDFYNENDLVAVCTGVINFGKSCTLANAVSVCGNITDCRYTDTNQVTDQASRVLVLQTAHGDNFLWSFFVSNRIEIAPPVISATNPANNASDILLTGSIGIDFDKIMMSSSLKTGGISIYNGNSQVTHKLINLKSLSNQAVGYWVVKENIDISVPLDGEADYTSAQLKHTKFSNSTSFRAQVGSGVKDIYQNCFKPSDGPACTGINQVDPSNPTCCSGTHSDKPSCP